MMITALITDARKGLGLAIAAKLEADAIRVIRSDIAGDVEVKLDVS